MSNIIERIERGEMVVYASEYGRITTAKDDQKNINELLRLAKLGAAMQWVPASERLPEHEQYIDIWIIDEEGDQYRVSEVEYNAESMVFATRDGDYDACYTADDIGQTRVTHWRAIDTDTPLPLPDPPGEGE